MNSAQRRKQRRAYKHTISVNVSRLNSAEKWALDNIGYTNFYWSDLTWQNHVHFNFKKQEDAVMFALRWSGDSG